MIEVGDKILLLVTGPHGAGLVPAEVTRAWSEEGHRQLFSNGCFRRGVDEGVTWIRGHDLNSPAARALLVAGTLGR